MQVIQTAIQTLAKKNELTYDMAYACMSEIMTGDATPVQMSAYLTALAIKGETIDEITGSAAGMRSHCLRLLHDVEAVEIVGTGGDGHDTFNISTTAAMITAAAGVPVAKHGNRSASSKCGAADVLEALGVNINLSPEAATKLLTDIDLCFLFAQNYHIAMKYVAPIRKELKIRTVFNLLGPLTNPAGATMELMGVYDKTLVEPLAQVMCNLGVKRAMVVHGLDGLDEISMTAPTYVCEVNNGWVKSYEITPEDFGLTRCTMQELKGGDPHENATILRRILAGEKSPKRDAALINAASALYISGKYDSLQVAFDKATQTVDSGAALAKLNQFIEQSNLYNAP